MYRNQKNKIKTVSSLCSQATATLTQRFNICVELVTYNSQQK